MARMPKLIQQKPCDEKRWEGRGKRWDGRRVRRNEIVSDTTNLLASKITNEIATNIYS